MRYQVSSSPGSERESGLFAPVVPSKLIYAHVLGALAFAAGHGVAATMAFRLRSERDPSRIAAILDYSL